jgi:hypothetical protein
MVLPQCLDSITSIAIRENKNMVEWWDLTRFGRSNFFEGVKNIMAVQDTIREIISGDPLNFLQTEYDFLMNPEGWGEYFMNTPRD